MTALPARAAATFTMLLSCALLAWGCGGGGGGVHPPLPCPARPSRASRQTCLRVCFTATTSRAWGTSRPPQGGTITLVGDVDYRRHQGHAQVFSQGGRDKVEEVVWDSDTALEYRPGMLGAVRKAKPGAVLIARQPDRQRRRLDQIIEIVTALAAPRRENPQLIRQRRQARFIRDDVLRGTPVQVLRYGPLTTVWVDPRTGRMLRFESSNQDKTAPIVVDLASTTAKSIQSPPAGAVVAASEVGDAWVKRGSTSP